MDGGAVLMSDNPVEEPMGQKEMEDRHLREFLKKHVALNPMLQILKNQHVLMCMQRYPSYDDHRDVEEAIRDTEALIGGLGKP